jgi:hypothetical protein
MRGASAQTGVAPRRRMDMHVGGVQALMLHSGIEFGDVQSTPEGNAAVQHTQRVVLNTLRAVPMYRCSTPAAAHPKLALYEYVT